MNANTTTLKDIGVYKTKLLSYLIKQQDLTDCMSLSSTGLNTAGLIYKQVFPYLYIDETQTEVLPYICVEANIDNSANENMKTVELRVWVYANRGCMKLSKSGYVGTRVDILCDIVDRTIREVNNELGIGQPDFIGSDTIFPQKQFYGREMFYRIYDFRLKEA